MLWLQEFRPTTWDDYACHSDIKQEMERWMDNALAKKSETYFLYLWGPPGTGKTTMAQLLMKKYGLDIIEWNAIDLKQTKTLEETLSKALFKNNIQVLVQGKKVVSGVILEECDCLQNVGKDILSRVTEHIKDVEYHTPMICTSNELEVDNIRAAKTIHVPQVDEAFLLALAVRICEAKGWCVSFDVLKHLKKFEDNDIRNWIMRLESIYTFFRAKDRHNDISVDMVNSFLQTTQKKERDMTIYHITEKVFQSSTRWNFISDIYNDSIILPMMVYTNVSYYNPCSNIDFLKTKSYISGMYVHHEMLREGYKKLNVDDLQKYSNCLSLGSVHACSHAPDRSSNITCSRNVSFPSTIYNKKYTECTHRKHLNYVMSEFNVSRRDLDHWSYLLYTMYLQSHDASKTSALEMLYRSIFPTNKDSDKLKDVFKCDFLRQEIKKRKKEAILKTLTSMLAVQNTAATDKKRRGRPRKV